MARRRFFVPGIHHRQAELTGDDAHHLVRVLRVEPGQTYEIADGKGGVWLAAVSEARKNRVLFDVGERLPLKPVPVRVTLAFALIKFDRLEWIFEKGTELGVEIFQPVIAERSERGLDKAAGKRLERWERIVLEAAQQSRRDELPEVRDVAPLREAAGTISAGLRLLLDEAPPGEGPVPLLAALPDAAARQPTDQVALLLGPEGGWTSAERAMIQGSGWKSVSLGPQVLRAETAAAAGVSLVMGAWLKPAGMSSSHAEALTRTGVDPHL